MVQDNKRASRYPRVGETPQEGDPKGVWCLILEEHLHPIDTTRYFLPTGEATEKMDKLIQDGLDFVKAARKLKRLLVKARADSKYLETGWENGVLVLKQKNLRAPRKNKKKPPVRRPRRRPR